MMKRAINIIFAVALMIFCMCMVSCSDAPKNENLWENATYTEDTQLGSGEKTLLIEVKADDKAVTFTIKTDKETVGEALTEHKLIDGEKGAYGLYVKKVNGILADYDINQSYWSFSKNGEYLSSGVDSTEFKDKDKFELHYTKQ